MVFGLRSAVCTQIIDASSTPDRFPQVAAEPRSCSVIRAMVGSQTSDMHRMRLIFAHKGSSAYSPRASRCIGGGWRLHAAHLHCIEGQQAAGCIVIAESRSCTPRTTRSYLCAVLGPAPRSCLMTEIKMGMLTAGQRASGGSDQPRRRSMIPDVTEPWSARIRSVVHPKIFPSCRPTARTSRVARLLFDSSPHLPLVSRDGFADVGGT